MRFVSFLSGGFITVIVVNPLDRKLAKRTSVHCSTYFAHLEYCHIRKTLESQGYKVLLDRGSTIRTMRLHWNSETPSEQEGSIGTMRLHQNNEAKWEQQGSIGTIRLHWNNEASS